MTDTALRESLAEIVGYTAPELLVERLAVFMENRQAEDTHELVEALENIITAAHWAQPTSIAGGGGPWRFDRSECFKEARAALSKAQGKEGG